MRETVVVTGALGDAGSWIVDALRKEYEVVAVDRSVPETTDLDGVTFLAVDLTDQGPVWETIVDADPTAVVHFGNIPHEVNHAGGDVYQNNAVSTHSKRRGGPARTSSGPPARRSTAVTGRSRRSRSISRSTNSTRSPRGTGTRRRNSPGR